MAALKNLLFLLAPVAMVMFPGSSSSAQTNAAAEVEVRTVKFSTVRQGGGGSGWLEATVELAVRGGTGGGPYARFVDRVQVSLSLAVRKRTEGHEFFRSSTELVSLEAGRAAVRFYLPPEILEREQVNTDPYAYLVDIAVRGRTVATAASPVLRSPDALQSFKDRVAQSAPGNDGILVPQYESPFMMENPGDTPSAIRKSR